MVVNPGNHCAIEVGSNLAMEVQGGPHLAEKLHLCPYLAVAVT